jgi:hypothetical protein
LFVSGGLAAGHTRGVTNIAVFSFRPQEVLDLANESASLIVFYATGPVVLSSGDQDLLGVGGHGAIDVLLTLDVQTRWNLSTLACWRWTAFDRGYWWRRKGNVDG